MVSTCLCQTHSVVRALVLHCILLGGLSRAEDTSSSCSANSPEPCEQEVEAEAAKVHVGLLQNGMRLPRSSHGRRGSQADDLHRRKAELLDELRDIEGATEERGCADTSPHCSSWATRGECEANPLWMLENCKMSCGKCSTAPGPAPLYPTAPPTVPPTNFVVTGACDTVEECGGMRCSSERWECYKSASWAMNTGIKQNPDWYPGLTQESHFEDFQKFMYDRNQASCPQPCAWSPPTTTTTTTTTTTPPRGTPACDPRPALPKPPTVANQYNGISWPKLCYVGLGEEHVFLIGDWGGLWREKKTAPNTEGARRRRSFGERSFVKGIDDKAQYLVADAFNARAKMIEPRYILNVGDNFYWGGIEERCGKNVDTAIHDFWDKRKDNTKQFYTIFEDVYKGKGIDGKPWFSVLGNHDYGGYYFYRAWDQQIAYTWAPGGRWLMPGQYWHQHVEYPTKNFTVDYFMIDTNINDVTNPAEDPMHNICSAKNDAKGANCKPFGPGSAAECVTWFKKLWDTQMDWMAKKLDASRADWQIIVTHFPPEHWTHYPDNTVDLKRLGDKYGIDLIVAGHRHDQELHPAGDWAVEIMDGYAAGIPFVVTGGGGGVTSENDPGFGNVKPQADQYGFMDMTLTKTELRIEAFNFNGASRGVMMVERRERAGKPLCSVYKCGTYDRKNACQCNPTCKRFNSCCPDFDEVCEPSCALYKCHAPYNADFQCQCNDHCKEYGSCCSDYDQMCASDPNQDNDHTEDGGVMPTDADVVAVSRGGRPTRSMDMDIAPEYNTGDGCPEDMPDV